MLYSYPFTEEMMPLWYLFIFVFGLCVGSFLNVCIWRMPRGESVVFTSSHCPSCNYKIKWYENIPVLSWLLLRGHCSNCKTSISFRYPAIELLTGILILIAWWRVVAWHQPISMFLLYLLATALFIVTFFVDLRHKIIPNRLTYSVIFLGLLLALFFPQATGKAISVEAFINSLLGFLVAGGILTIVLITGKLILKKDALGWGDVKFLAAVGACFGLYPPVWFFCILVGSILGTIIGLIMIFVGRGKWSTALPFGAFLSVAGYLWILCGEEMITYYFMFCKVYLS